MAWTKEELKNILQLHFIEEPFAFTAGRRNDDMVDSMCICFALDEEWTEMYAKHVDNCYTGFGSVVSVRDWKYIEPHYERVKKWLEQKEANGYKRGEFDIMSYSINY